MKKIILPLVVASIAGLVFVNSNNAIGYSGLTAPSDQSSGARNNEPRGYKGLIPGYVPQYKSQEKPDYTYPDEEEKTQKNQTKSNVAPRVRDYNRNNNYRRGTRDKISDIPQFKSLKTLEGKQFTSKDLDNKSTRYFAEKMRFSPRNAELFKHQKKVDGMWPVEYRAKTTINQMIGIINNSSGADKRRNAKLVMERLEGLESMNRTIAIIPKDIKVRMGYPSEYLRQEEEGIKGALRRISQAKQQVKRLI